MQKAASAIPSAVPIFMAVGTADSMARVAEESIFKKVPNHEKSKYVSVPTDHMGVASVIGPELMAWLESVGN